MAKSNLKIVKDNDYVDSKDIDFVNPKDVLRLRNRYFKNKIADYCVSLSGMLIIFSILAIFFVILFQALPLFYPATSKLSRSIPDVSQSDVISISSLPDNESFVILNSKGNFHVVNSSNDINYNATVAELLPEEIILKAVKVTSYKLILISNLGRVLEVELDSSNLNSLKINKSFQLTQTNFKNLTEVSYLQKEKGYSLAFAFKDVDNKSYIKIFSVKKSASLMASNSFKVKEGLIPIEQEISSLEVSEDESLIITASDDKKLQLYNISSYDKPALIPEASVSLSSKITALKYLIGKQLIVSGHEDGQVKTWEIIKNPNIEKTQLGIFSEFPSQQGAVKQIVVSTRNRSFYTLAGSGAVNLYYSTTQSKKLEIRASEEIVNLGINESGSLLMLTDKKGIKVYEIHNPYPEVSLKSIFGKVKYEGYSEGQYLWQSSSGSDEFESKLSLIPLIFGTIKGTIYSLLFAVPLALFGALYSSEFMSSRVKKIVKPIIEIMAAVPTVVIGFVAGLWLAPNFSKFILTFSIFPLLCWCLIYFTYSTFSKSLPLLLQKYRTLDFYLVAFLASVALGLSVLISPSLEAILFKGNLVNWLNEDAKIPYDQRNSLIVSIAMGFAIIPIIFTISEDTLTAVPQHYRNASLALGAGKWQTAINVVLPAASPGLFSAVMLGFSRAIGETMIVLMATGNTAIMDLSPFNGFRAMSANIAVELPEAIVGGGLYRVIFLSALLLFCFTFILNTITEVIRVRLRRKYN